MARQTEDGTWDVHNVPVFTVIKKGTKGAPRNITETDLRSAVDRHQQLFNEDKFLARTNVLHNYGVHRPTPAGFFLPHSVRPFRMKRQSLPTIFADLIGVPDAVFREMDSDGLPYCSVEVRTYEPLTFGALALLDTEPPFFEFPLITIGTKEYAQLRPDAAVAPADDAPIALAHFCFREASMPDDKPYEDEKDEKEGQMQEGEGGDSKSAVKSIEAVLKELEPILALKDKILEMVGGGGGSEPEEEEAVGAVTDEPVAAMSAKPPDTEIARLEGRVAGLEQYRSDREAKDKRDLMFNSAVKDLEADGYSLPDKILSHLRKLAKIGEEAFLAYIEGYREYGMQDPPDDFTGPMHGDNVPDEVMKFSSKGPEVFAAAKRAWREWSELPEDRFRSPLNRYLEREVG